MQKFLRLAFFLALIAGPLSAQVRHLGDVEVPVDKNSIAVRVSANTTELNALALMAFGSDGAYVVRGYDYAYDIRFTLVGPAEVRLDIMKGRQTTPALSQLVPGTSARNALLRAADIAVDRTNPFGLRGYFTSRLTFVGEGTGKKEIYTSDLFLGDVKRITNDHALALSPRWSPDGSKILYTSYARSGFPDILELNLATMRQTVFASFRGTNTGARYSPNGSQVAMVLSGTGSPEIWIANARGGSAPVRRTHSDEAKSSPCWSPDGSRIVFAMQPGPQLFVMSAGGGGLQRLRTGYSYTAEPDWSRTNPNKIACTVMAGGYQIAVYDFSTGRAEVVSRAPFDGIEPCWLPDGRHLVYTARTRTSSVLCILDTVTGKSTSLTHGSAVGNAMQACVWTPR
ncbi:MAG TPA: biopolymer transporter Tol [Opitutaceae bacterium]|nr:biopolymer transporter Tol [Opitutaceae bacterium]